MKFTVANLDDINRYFRATYVKFQEMGEKLFYIQKVTHETLEGVTTEGKPYKFTQGQIIGQDEDGEYFVLYLDEDVPYEMTYTLPTRGIFPYQGRVLYLYRNPQRQYQRGMSDGNTTIVDVFSGDAVSLSMKVLREFVNKPTYTPLNEALFGKAGKRVLGYVVAHRVSFRRSDQTFFIDMKRVAVFNREKMSIEMIKGMEKFQPEIDQLGPVNEKEFV